MIYTAAVAVPFGLFLVYGALAVMAKGERTAWFCAAVMAMNWCITEVQRIAP